MNRPTTDYSSLSNALSSASLRITPSEAHGALCGLLSSGYSESKRLWMEELMPDGIDSNNLLLTECHQQLDALYQETLESFDGPGVGFSLLLPDDDQPLPVRASEMLVWCQGFLYGLGLSQAPLNTLTAETQEGLKDITEIIRMDLDSLGGSEGEEVDLAEISEFIWVAVMLVREELVHHPRGE